MKKIMLAIMVALLTVSGVNAASFTFDMGSGSYIDTSLTASALEMKAQVSPAIGALNYTLTVGQSKTFDFAKIWTNESAINSDDLVPSVVNAYLDFDVPNITPGVTGASVGFSANLNFNQGWKLSWSDPVLVAFNGGEFKVDLEDAYFSQGWWLGPDGSDCIKATVTLVRVPEPTSIVLLGLGLACLAGVGRRKFKN